MPDYVSGWVVVVEELARGIAVTVFLRCIETGIFHQFFCFRADVLPLGGPLYTNESLIISKKMRARWFSILHAQVTNRSDNEEGESLCNWVR